MGLKCYYTRYTLHGVTFSVVAILGGEKNEFRSRLEAGVPYIVYIYVFC